MLPATGPPTPRPPTRPPPRSPADAARCAPARCPADDGSGTKIAGLPSAVSSASPRPAPRHHHVSQGKDVGQLAVDEARQVVAGRQLGGEPCRPLPQTRLVGRAALVHHVRLLQQPRQRLGDQLVDLLRALRPARDVHRRQLPVEAPQLQRLHGPRRGGARPPAADPPVDLRQGGRRGRRPRSDQVDQPPMLTDAGPLARPAAPTGCGPTGSRTTPSESAAGRACPGRAGR